MVRRYKTVEVLCQGLDCVCCEIAVCLGSSLASRKVWQLLDGTGESMTTAQPVCINGKDTRGEGESCKDVLVDPSSEVSCLTPPPDPSSNLHPPLALSLTLWVYVPLRYPAPELGRASQLATI